MSSPIVVFPPVVQQRHLNLQACAPGTHDGDDIHNGVRPSYFSVEPIRSCFQVAKFFRENANAQHVLRIRASIVFGMDGFELPCSKK
jgi:hypothetical protein